MIYFLAHSDWILFNSRKEISKNLISQHNFEVTAITPDGDYKDKLESFFSGMHLWDINSFKLIDLNGIKKLRMILKNLNENDVLHIFTLKSGLYALFALTFYQNKFKIVLSITGLGYLFSKTFISKVIRNLLRFYMRFFFKKKIDVLIFQNEMDEKILSKYVNFQNKSYLIRGSGLKLSNFELKNIENQLSNEIKIIMCCRLLKDKGINEYVQLAKFLNDEKYKFYLAGDVDLGNPASFSKDEIMSMTKEADIEYLGWIDTGSDLKDYDISICMSYHEGLPRIVLESMYIGLHTISNKLPGLIPIFDNDDNGTLISGNNQAHYVDAIKEFSKIRDLESKVLNSRNKISNNFSTEKISKDLIMVYEKL